MMNTNNYFNPAPTTLEELKSTYRNLAKKFHPDKGGCLETMKTINAEYDRLFPKLKDIHKNKDGETYTKENAETPDYFKNLINELMKFEGVVIEIIGCFVWLSGNTKPYKDQIKALNFKWHTKKLVWYLPPEDYRKRSRKNYDLDEIRSMYGTSGSMHSKGMMKIEESTA
jgi:curved DNA-binding protein CbpA